MISLKDGQQYEMGPCYIVFDNECLKVIDTVWVFLKTGPEQCHKTEKGYFQIDQYVLERGDL